MADEIIPTEGIRQSQIPAGGLRPIIGGQVSMYGRTPASPPIRYGALRSDDGVYAGRVPFQPVNDSASPVIGAYSPYPTMLFAPRRPDSFVMMMDMMRSMRPNIDYTKMIQDLSKRAAKMPTRRGGRTGTGTPPLAVQPPRGAAVPGRWSTADDYGLIEQDRDSFGLMQPGFDPRFTQDWSSLGRSGRLVRPDSMEGKGQIDAAQGQSFLDLVPSHTSSNINEGRSQRPPRDDIIVVPTSNGMTPVQQLPQQLQQPQQWILRPSHRQFTGNRG